MEGGSTTNSPWDGKVMLPVGMHARQLCLLNPLVPPQTIDAIVPCIVKGHDAKCLPMQCHKNRTGNQTYTRTIVDGSLCVVSF